MLQIFLLDINTKQLTLKEKRNCLAMLLTKDMINDFNER